MANNDRIEVKGPIERAAKRYFSVEDCLSLVDRSGLLNRCARNCTRGSNPLSSANIVMGV